MSVVAPEQLAAVGVVAAPEAAEGLAAVEAGVEGVKVAVRGAGAATAIVGAGEDVVEGGAEAGKGARVGSNTKAAAARRPAQLSAETSRITRLHTHMIRMSDTLRDLVILDFKKSWLDGGGKDARIWSKGSEPVKADFCISWAQLDGKRHGARILEIHCILHLGGGRE